MLNRRLLSERVEKWLSPLYWNDINLCGKTFSDPVQITDIFVYEPDSESRPYFESVREIPDLFSRTVIGTSFGTSWTTKWFKFSVEVPRHFESKIICLFWDSSSEALFYDSSGIPLQAFTGGGGEDRRDMLIISRCGQPGSLIHGWIEMACNEMFGNGSGGLIQPPDVSRSFQLRVAEIRAMNGTIFSLFWDVKVLHDIMQNLPQEHPTSTCAMVKATQIINTVDLQNNNSIEKSRRLASEIFQLGDGTFGVNASTTGSHFKTNHEVVALGHCHIDTAWLWPYAETRRKVMRSWCTQMTLFEKYPTWKFVASQTVQYEWLKEDSPATFQRLRTYVSWGRFVPVGGSYVEFDANIPSGESMIRQFLYGGQFFQQEFQIKSKTFWLPDTFGYSAQLPQILTGFGITYFLSQKLSWNLFNK